ncbi:hypothetical protein Aab01nite_65500 [Paractinoplanes abujensis]|uniref:Uncharacterized protein n=1 Tax=Paractinoplanes abujensis TaxID=882441 RepID=A0A7W7G1C5_9ACTN|nr:hypothetical protein [Actinoplanes abujensis]MBB4692542.1 hypothetical protein [Actinoplanes abujensis]GID22960.1 hypothetical protein Aab01nite_65500 [Actinoplanes abujensis]
MGEELVTYDRSLVRDEITRIALLLDNVIIPHTQDHPDGEWA